MTREEAILWMQVLKHSKINWVGEQAEDEDIIARCEEAEQEAFDMAIEALSADAEQIVYCMDCAKSEPLDEHGALWYCKAHDRTTLRHSYCDNGERKGGEDE